MALPIWLLIFFPRMWLFVAPVNFIIDSLVLLIGMYLYKLENKKGIYKKVIIKVFLFGFLSDFIGALPLTLITLHNLSNDALSEVISAVMLNPFRNAWAFIWVSCAICLSMWCIYFFNSRVSFKKLDIAEKERKKLSLFIAIFTAPYFFYLPTAWFF